MNRKILFRGKRREWIEGCLLDFKENTYIIPHDSEYCYDDTEKLAFDVERFEVVTEATGQYTGLNDKNGTKIFEGDIISVRYIEDADYVYGIPERIWFEQFEVYFDNEHHCWYARHIIDKEDAYWLYEFDEECTVIGNIHDKPEFFKE